MANGTLVDKLVNRARKPETRGDGVVVVPGSTCLGLIQPRASLLAASETAASNAIAPGGRGESAAIHLGKRDSAMSAVH